MLFAPKVAAARAAAALSRRAGAGGGTALPGKLLLRAAPEALGRLAAALPDGTALVSATNGKTTSAKMAAAMLEPEVPLCANRAGANLASGVASALLHCRGARMGLFEVDEAALPGVAAALRPRIVALGNLFRDQLDRYGELELLGAGWGAAVDVLPASTRLVVNADDPLVGALAARRAEPLRYGIDDPAVALPALPHAADSKWCPACGARLGYAAVYLGHLGDHACPQCGLARGPLDVAARDVRLEGLDATAFTLATPAGTAPVRLPVPGVYNVYNALAAAAVAHAAGVAVARIAAGLERFSAAFGRFERVVVDGRRVTLLLVKNPAGANEAVRTLLLAGAPRHLLVALNDRIADGRDVSWIWDVDLEPLGERAERVVVSGTRAAEMGVRFKYGGVPPERIAVVPSLAGALGDAVASAAPGADVYLLATYTAMLELRALLARRGVVEPYWKAAA
jgi:UDP-N-acetylmuramyl tripeptide synthase